MVARRNAAAACVADTLARLKRADVAFAATTLARLKRAEVYVAQQRELLADGIFFKSLFLPYFVLP